MPNDEVIDSKGVSVVAIPGKSIAAIKGVMLTHDMAYAHWRTWTWLRYVVTQSLGPCERFQTWRGL